MERIFLLVALSLPLLPLSAQYGVDYNPFVKEGKVWNWGREWDDGIVRGTYDAAGDTVIGVQTYKKLYHTDSETGLRAYAGGLREDGYRVYFVPQGEAEQLLFDFDLDSIVTVETGVTTEDDSAGLEATLAWGRFLRKAEDGIVVRGRAHRLLTVGYGFKEGEADWEYSWEFGGADDYWLDGVGGVNNPFGRGLLLSCYEGGECLYDRSEERMEDLALNATRCTAADFAAGSFLAEAEKRWVVAHVGGSPGDVTLRSFQAGALEEQGYVWQEVLFHDGGGDDVARYAVREWDGKAYVLGDAPKQSQLLYDFRAEPGDSVPLFGRDGTGAVTALDSVYVVEKGEIESCGRTYPTMVVERRKQHFIDPATGRYARTTLIRGIGNAEAAFENVFTVPAARPEGYDVVIQCYVGDELIYANIPDEIRDFVGISQVATAPRAAKTPFHDLQGRRLRSAPQRGVYLQGGRKVMAR